MRFTELQNKMLLSVEDELRSLIAWGKAMLFILVVQQWILMYCLLDSWRVKQAVAGWMFSTIVNSHNYIHAWIDWKLANLIRRGFEWINPFCNLPAFGNEAPLLYFKRKVESREWYNLYDICDGMKRMAEDLDEYEVDSDELELSTGYD